MRVDELIKKNGTACTGCSACANACPAAVNAIEMREDGEGFRYPQIDENRCINCGACVRACPVLTPVELQDEAEPETYAYMSTDEEVRRHSSSGGCFYGLAKQVIEDGGVVFGAGFDAKWEVEHQSADNLDSLRRLCTSKYVQSRIGETYRSVRAELKTGRPVLFVGTPCQCAGLHNYLHGEYVNLLLVDFICHGVPSPRVWRKYIAFLSQKNRKEIRRISFRNKNLSWERFLLTIDFVNVNKYLGYAQDLNHDLYLKGFLQNLYLRPSCYECQFCRRGRVTDVTLADYWGVAEEEPDMYDGRGTSLVLVHSERGRRAFGKLDGRSKRTEYMRAVKHNPSYIRPAMMNPKRRAFFQELNDTEDICRLLRRYTKMPLRRRVVHMVKAVIKTIPGAKRLYHHLKQ